MRRSIANVAEKFARPRFRRLDVQGSMVGINHVALIH